MRVGDVLEIVAAACFTAAAYLWAGAPPALIVAGACLAYLAQCYGTHRFPRIHVPKLAKNVANPLDISAARRRAKSQ